MFRSDQSLVISKSHAKFTYGMVVSRYISYQFQYSILTWENREIMV